VNCESASRAAHVTVVLVDEMKQKNTTKIVVVSAKESGKKREKCLTLSFIGKKVRFDRTALFYCKMRKQSVKDSGIKSSPL
jgi:hypothetical protein